MTALTHDAGTAERYGDNGRQHSGTWFSREHELLIPRAGPGSPPRRGSSMSIGTSIGRNMRCFLRGGERGRYIPRHGERGRHEAIKVRQSRVHHRTHRLHQVLHSGGARYGDNERCNEATSRRASFTIRCSNISLTDDGTLTTAFSDRLKIRSGGGGGRCGDIQTQREATMGDIKR